MFTGLLPFPSDIVGISLNMINHKDSLSVINSHVVHSLMQRVEARRHVDDIKLFLFPLTVK